MDPTTLVAYLVQHHTTVSILFAEVVNLIALHALFEFLCKLALCSYEHRFFDFLPNDTGVVHFEVFLNAP